MRPTKKQHWTHPAVVAFVGTQPEHRLATLLEDVNGKGNFTHWKAGEVVKVHRVKGARWFTIEKLKPKLLGRRGCRFAPPLLNECCNIPLKALNFLDEWPDRQ